MSSHRIEKILEKYFEGETSLTEERRLKEFFRQKDLPAHLEELREQFEVYEKEGSIYLPHDFDDKLFERIEKRDRGRRLSRRTTLYYLSGVAATILILLTVFFRFDPFVSGPQDIDMDTELAFTQASNILYYVSDKFNKGADPLGKIASFDKGVKNLNTVKKFDEGMNKTAPISRFNQITKLITNPAP